MNALKWLDKNFEKVLLIVLLVIMTLVMFVQIVLRYVFSNSLSWADELCRYLLIASTFISIGYSVRHKSALKVDIVTNFAPPFVNKVLNIFTEIITTAFCGYFTYAAFRVIIRAGVLAQKSAALQLPQTVLYGVACFGFAIGTIRGVQSLVRTIISKPEKIKAEEK